MVNTHAAVAEIFGRRGEKYADRPRFPMLVDIGGWDFLFGVFNFTERYKAHRRLFDSYFKESVSRKMRDEETLFTRKLLKRVLEQPNSLNDHLIFHGVRLALPTVPPVAYIRPLYQRTQASLICSFYGVTVNAWPCDPLTHGHRLLLDLVYGIDAKDHENRYIQVTLKALDIFNHPFCAGEHFINALPWLQYLPAWFPGMSCKYETMEWRSQVQAMRDEPFEYTLKKGAEGKGMVKTILEQDPDPSKHEMLKSVTASIMQAGSDTTIASLRTIVLLCLVFPDAQDRAYKELSSVIGRDRLPTFDDKAQLPYVQAFCRELIRWSCVIPIPAPHRAREDDVWINPQDGKGYLIPKGTTVMGNSWALSRDPALYPEPELFNPERWLISDGSALNPKMKSPEYVFGYRPRTCPGRFMADDSLFIAVASLLPAFRFEPLPEDRWEPVYDKLFVPALNVHPKAYQCTVVTREAGLVGLLREVDL